MPFYLLPQIAAIPYHQIGFLYIQLEPVLAQLHDFLSGYFDTLGTVGDQTSYYLRLRGGVEYYLQTYSYITLVTALVIRI